MPARARRRLELLQLSEPLRRYASSLTPDINASSFLVHQALSAAFAEADVRPSVGLEASLRRDIERNCAFATAARSGTTCAAPSSAS
jgi:hypothetical protein